MTADNPVQTTPQPSTELDITPAVDAHLSALNRRQRAFVKTLVWDGLQFTQAFKRLGIPERTAYYWMRLPVIRQALKAEEQVLRSSARAGNIHALIRVRDESKNHLAVVQAVKALEEIANPEHAPAGPGQQKGYLIVLPAPTQAPYAAGAAAAGTGQVLDGVAMVDITPAHGPAHGRPGTTEGGGE